MFTAFLLGHYLDCDRCSLVVEVVVREVLPYVFLVSHHYGRVG
jgi:hypothetical protein